MLTEKIQIYQHIRLDTNEIFYIGIGINRRPFTKSNRNKHWNNIVSKYGYRVEIITTCDSWEEACQIEKYLIKYYGRRDLGFGSLVNMTDGGDGMLGFNHSEETKEKLREANLGIKRTEETKLKIGESIKGENHPMYGRKHSEETIIKMSHSKKGKKLTQEQKNNKSKKIIDISTGIIYNSPQEISDIFNINRSTLYNKLTGHRLNNTNFKYLE